MFFLVLANRARIDLAHPMSDLRNHSWVILQKPFLRETHKPACVFSSPRKTESPYIQNAQLSVLDVGAGEKMNIWLLFGDSARTMFEMIFSIILVIILIVVVLAAFLFASLDLIGYMATDVPFVPIQNAVVEKIVALAPAHNGIFYDLGSGEGRVVVAMARRYPEMRAVGVEKAPLPQLLTKFRLAKKPDNAHFIFKDMHGVSLADASYVYIYLLTKITHDLEPKFEKELKKGARLVSCDFPLKNREPKEKHVIQKGGSRHTLYVYDW